MGNIGRRVMRGFGLMAALAAVGWGLLLWRSPEPGGIDDAWMLAFGTPDLGPVDFPSLRRRSSPNDALVCPLDVCPNAEADLVPPVFDVPGERLRAIVAEVALSEPNTAPVFSAQWDEQDRYLVRTRLMRFPDTVDAKIIGQGEGRSTLALYSRSQIGYSDLGVNRARVERWLKRITELAAEKPETIEG